MFCAVSRLPGLAKTALKMKLQPPRTVLKMTFLTSSSAIIAASSSSSHLVVAHHNDKKNWIMELIQFLKIIVRGVQMVILVTPLILTAPFAMMSQSCQAYWFEILISTIQACGPVYVKLGQWASTRRDIFPPILCNSLSRLQRQVNKHAWHHTKSTLERHNLTEAFESFDEDPVGSGCCAQVYKAKYKGQDVAVKILHPKIKSNFLRDLVVLKSIVNGVSWMFPQLNWLSVKESLNEFANLMNVQVDLRNEAQNLLKFHENFKNDSEIKFPRPLIHLCNEEVLVESFEQGLHLGNLIQDLGSITEERRKLIAAKGVQMFLKMVFRHNFVHADLHPGNILVSTNDNLVILDPGLTTTLSPKDRRNFRAVFSAVVRGDGARVGKEILEQSEQDCQNPSQFIAEIEQIVIDGRSKLSLATVDVADLLTKVFNVLRHHRVKLEPNFTSVILSIMVLEGLGRTLDPELDLLWAAAPFLLK